MKCVIWAAVAIVSGCGAAARTAPPTTAAPSALVAPSPASAATQAPPDGFPEAAQALAAERVTGAIALFDTRDGKLRCSDPDRCDRRYLPASTFKIANSIIGLETGVLSDAESPLPWDGKEYANAAWNRDNTLRSAVQVSCVPCFRSIARQVGPARMAEWVTRLDYGNHDTSGQADLFWLRGALRITPSEQVDFLRRLDFGKLPIQEHTLDVVRDVLTLDVTPSYIFRGKTGYASPPDEVMEVGWFVGWVELGERRVFFATVIDGHAPDVDVVPVRRRVTESVLRALGDLPA
ncbi:MAG: penicillin-binding transpeptidase domain-containing protein [Polyangiaceae bacterium]